MTDLEHSRGLHGPQHISRGDGLACSVTSSTQGPAASLGVLGSSASSSDGSTSEHRAVTSAGRTDMPTMQSSAASFMPTTPCVVRPTFTAPATLSMGVAFLL